MEIDENDRYLATGDANGIVKVWNIKNYCLNTNLNSPLIATERKCLI
jgi:hypothetical protein